MESHEGATMIKTFRGLIADGDTDTIVLHTNDGSIGYKIVNFQVIQEKPGTQNAESIVTIKKVDFTPVSTVDLSDNTILAVAFYGAPQNAQAYPIQEVIIFEQEIFNQDIYIGNQDIGGEASKINYYLELEQLSLDFNENTVATLKNIKNEANIL